MELTDAKADLLPRKRRWCQLRLRTLFIVMVLASVGLSWYAVKARRSERQRNAIEAIMSSGAGVGRSVPFEPSSTRPQWLVDRIGPDFFYDVTRVWFNGKGTDEAMAHIESFPQLSDLDLLRSSHVTDKGLEHVRHLTHLYSICLDGTQVTDAGMAHLEGLTSLHILFLNDTAVTDSGLEHVRGLKQLRQLGLNNSGISDGALRYIGELTDLQSLYLGRTRVTDAGLEHVKGLTSLGELRLDGTQVTDAGLIHLASLAGLRFLYLKDTKVTDEGINKLRQALPNCKIER